MNAIHFTMQVRELSQIIVCLMIAFGTFSVLIIQTILMEFFVILGMFCLYYLYGLSLEFNTFSDSSRSPRIAA